MKRYVVTALLFVMGLVLPAWAEVTYSLSQPSPLLNEAYYDGIAGPGAPESLAGRFAFLAKPSKDGTQVAFIGVNRDYSGHGLYVVEVGDPTNWRRVADGFFGDLATPLGWSPDQSHVYVDRFRVNVATGVHDEIGYAHDSEGNPTITVLDGNTAHIAGGYWMIGSDENQIMALPIHADGSFDDSREPKRLTNFVLGGTEIAWPTISPSGTRIGFHVYTPYPLPTPELGDIYILQNVASILLAPPLDGTNISSLAPTDLFDPNVVTIRTTDDGVDNFAAVPNFSQDESILFYGEDWNNAFNDNDLFETIAAGNWDVMISNTDGTGADFRVPEPDPLNPVNQFVLGVTPGGIRIIYMTDDPGHLALFATSLQTETTVDGNDVSNSVIEVEAGEGTTEEVTLGDNAVQIPPDAADPVVVSEASETTVILPPGQVVDFPSGASQTISISTPIDPAEPSELPAEVDGIPVLRSFGPEGTHFYPPVTIMISYTQVEIAGLDEETLLPYVFNTTTHMFEAIDPADVVARDVVANRITFRVSHFSLYGVGGQVMDLPISTGVWWAVAVTVIGLGALRMFRHREDDA